jgi:type I restriction enzyme S subunit
MPQDLYKLPKGWEWKELPNIARIGAERGFVPSETDGQVSFVSMGDIDQETGLNSTHQMRPHDEVRKGYTKFQRDAVLVAKITPCTQNNKTALMEVDGYATTEVYPVHSLGKLYPPYLLHFFRSPFIRDLMVGSMVGATGRQRVPTETLQSLQIPLPPLGEQARIVEKLGALFSRIDAATARLNQILTHTQSLFASALADAFSSAKGLPIHPLKAVFRVINGRAYKKAELLASGKYPVVRIQNLKGGDSYYYSDLELKPDKYCDHGDLVFSWSGTPGTSFGAFIWEGGKSIYHYHIWKMEPLVDLDIRFGYWLLRNLTQTAIDNSRGVAGMLHITKGMMESFEIPLPTLEEQQRIVEQLDGLSSRIQTLEKTTRDRLDYLAALKASLLDAAFRGKL